MSMIITRKTVAEELAAYLNRRVSLARLVDWAEDTLCDGELLSFDEIISAWKPEFLS